MTGKGDRWGRDSVGRSAPVFLSANISALPPPTCTARREAGQLCGQLCFCCEAGQLLAVVLRPEPDGESAGCVCLQLPCSAGCVPACLCLPCPLPFISSCPRSVFIKLLCPVHLLHCALPLFMPCAPGSPLLGPAVCKLRELSRWQLQHGPAVAARAPVHLW